MNSQLGKGPVPKQALLLSLLSLWVPVASSALFPDWTGDTVGVLVWLLALVPGFLLSYYRGWKGASVALAGGMAALSVAQVVILLIAASPPSPSVLFAMVSVLTVVSLGSGWLSTHFHRSLEQAERLALTDSGTGIPNRRHALLDLEKAFAAAKRGAKISVVLFDLDHFKRVNDLYGHPEGDRVLAMFAEILRTHNRAMNTTARFGGEEFIAVLRDSEAAGARVFAERVRQALKALTFPSGPITVSAGIAEYEDGMASPDVLVAAADQALYRAKSEGRDRVVVIGRKGRHESDGHRADTSEDDEAPEGRGELLLVVDDDVDALRSISRTLRRFGYTVLESPSPRRAVEIARGLDEPLDAVLTDIVMPEMGGFRLVEMLQEVQEDVRVLYLSGYSQDDVDWGGVPGAVREFLTKPVSIYTLARRVRWLLDQPASTRKIPFEGTSSEAEESHAEAEAPSGDGFHYPVGTDQRVLVLHSDDARGDLVTRLLKDNGIRCDVVRDGPSTVMDGLIHMRVDLMIVDLDLPRDGLSDLLALLEKYRVSTPALLFLVGDQNRDLRQRALKLPMVDFVHKPFPSVELDVRARNLLRTRSYERWIGFVEDDIRNRVAARTAELEEAREEVLRRLAGAAEFRDDLTGRHAERVGILSGLIASRLGLPRERKETIEKAAPLHDLGKIAIPDSILKKSGDLTPSERDVMRRHTLIGRELLAGSRNPIIQAAEEIALSHHEHWDGSGYPRGIAGEGIPESGRIVAVADAFDSLTNHRPYRDGVSAEDAFEIIRQASGSQFDPRIVEAFASVLETEQIEDALNVEIVAYPDETNNPILRNGAST